MNKIIKVTKNHIKKGFKDNCNRCPVALALKEQLKTESIAVANAITFIEGGRYYLPDQAREFITRFDGGEKVKPFSFKLVI